MNSNDKIIAILTICLLIIGLYGISELTRPDYIKNLVKYDEHYNDARNQTLQEINSNTTILQKMTIISFNCEKINIGSGWVNQCKDDLSKEIIQK